jgi:NAD(P)-dependent dehydrogenase (short-subunit alcohol dehydrogenase family)
LLIGASRGLGLAMAAEFLSRKWNVVGTVRGESKTKLHDLADEYTGELTVENLDVIEQTQIERLRDRLTGQTFDILFVNAGTANSDRGETVADVSTDEFVRVMVTNSLAPMRIVETLQGLVNQNGLIGIMSSGQGSVSNNEKGGADVYRASKSALNQLMRCYAARHSGEQRALVLMAPGWIRTDLGGSQAPTSVEEAIPKVVDVLLSLRGKTGLRYCDREGNTVPW